VRTFANPYTEQAYRRSVTGLDEEIREKQRRLAIMRTRIGQRMKRLALNDLLELHRKRNKLMEVKTSAQT
jgi:hypothetical protein